MIHILIKLFKFIFVIYIIASEAYAKDILIVGTSTSAYDSGLADYISNAYQKKFNSEIYFISKATGQILEIAKRGDVDIVIVHNKNLEENFIKKGFGFKRYQLMYNNFVIVGPKSDPADVKKSETINEVMKKIVESESIFVSRSDLSGTNLRELSLWKNAGIKIDLLFDRYKKIGAGMGYALKFTNDVGGYTLSDKATWESFKHKSNLKILFDKDTELVNQYSIILNKNSNNYEFGEVFMEWILSNEGKKLINGYKINNHQIFFFNGDSYIKINNE